jgi:hypothetical protein
MLEPPMRSWGDVRRDDGDGDGDGALHIDDDIGTHHITCPST